MALAAGALGVPVQLSRLTVGPFTGIADRLVGVALFQLADEISIRDRRYSRRELRHLATFGSRVRETADAAWHLASAPSSVIDRALRDQGIPPDEPLAVLSGHGPDVSAITEQLGAVAGALAENHGLRSLFIPMVTGAAANDEDFAGDLVTSLPADTPAADLAAAAGRQLGRASGTRDLWLGSSSGASWFGPLERRRGVRSGRAPAPPEVDPRVEGSDGGVEIAEVALAANPDALDDLGRFYRDELRIAQAQRSDGDLALRVGPAGLRFRPAGGAGQPFYHFALLVPGDRFQAARDWLAGHAELLPRPDSPATVFDFDAWQAQACYCHDPAGNIVELIAHRGVAERRESSGRFSAEELAGISELGVVVPSPARAAELLRSELGLELWDGAVDERGGLGFVGSKAQTLILCAPGRGWLPTGRPASIHPVHVTLTGARPGEVGVPRTPHRIRVSSRSGP